MQTGVTGTHGCGHCAKHRYHGDILPSVAFGSVHRQSLGKTCGPCWNPVASPSGTVSLLALIFFFRLIDLHGCWKGKTRQRESISFIGKSHLLQSCHSRIQSVAEGRWYCCLCNDLAQVQYHGNRFHMRVRVDYNTSAVCIAEIQKYNW